MRVASAFIRKNSDEIVGLRALGFEAGERIAPMLGRQPSPPVEVSQCLLRRPLKVAIYAAPIIASSVSTVRHWRSLAGLFDASELVEVQEF
jgi:hypothetical protein